MDYEGAADSAGARAAEAREAAAGGVDGLEQLLGPGFLAGDGRPADALPEEAAEPSSAAADFPELPARKTTLGDLLAAAGVVGRVTLDAAAADTPVRGLCADSREVRAGDLFFCQGGSAVDGHDFAAAAVEAGAAAVVCGRDLGSGLGVPQVVVDDPRDALGRVACSFFDDPSAAMTTVGVTGTNGKTTTTWLVRGILEEWGRLVGLMGTLEYSLADARLDPRGEVWVQAEDDPSQGLSRTVPYVPGGGHIAHGGKYGVPNTTPDALRMQRLLASMADRGADAAVMEVSSHALDQGRVAHVDFDVAVFTNLSRDHLDYHADMDEYAAAKGKLFQGLGDPGRQRAVLNLDDPLAEKFMEWASPVPSVTYSVSDPRADVHCTTYDLGLFETALQISTPAGSFELSSGLVGETNVSNIVAAAAAGVALGAPLSVIQGGLEAIDYVPGRYEVVDDGQDFLVVVDYAHTPDALERCIKDMRGLGAEKVITVFGCGGDRDRGKRPLMGRVAHENSDIVIVTNDNPRSENADLIIDDVVRAYAVEIMQQNPEYWDFGYNWMSDMHTCLEWGYLKEVKDHPNNARAAWWTFLELQDEARRYVISERYAAIRYAVGMAGPGDAVIVAGKGHEDYQEFYDSAAGAPLKTWFDDRVECYAALREIAKFQAAGVHTQNLPWHMRQGPKKGRRGRRGGRVNKLPPVSSTPGLENMGMA